jgi:multidrug efflux pump subunit AcrA (membrane-fusion protein)
MMDERRAAADAPLFREEALRNRNLRLSAGEVLRLSPLWIERTFWVLVAALLTSLVYAVVGTVNEYAAGPAVVRLDARADLVAKAEGVIDGVLVKPGQHVAEGALLVRFDDAVQQGELASVSREYELELAKRLRDPPAAAPLSFGQLRARQELARGRLAERSLRAPVSGVVGDVRVRPGQHVNPGDVVLSLVRDDATFSLVAMLPGSYRPLLRRGMPLRFEIAGFQYAYQDLEIDALGDEIVGPAEVKRFLSQENADALSVTGPVVLVSARLPARTFTSSGDRFNYYDGMQGRAEARVRADSLIVSFIPALRSLYAHGN